MSALFLIEKLSALGVRISISGDQLKLNAPKGAVTPELLQDVAAHKPEIMARIQGKPFIDSDDNLHVPHDADPRYRWWQGGQSVAETLRELNAPDSVMKLYADEPF